jgi:hypothetical protein
VLTHRNILFDIVFVVRWLTHIDTWVPVHVEDVVFVFLVAGGDRVLVSISILQGEILLLTSSFSDDIAGAS